MSVYSRLVCVVTSSLLLALGACGGGGSADEGGSTPPPPQQTGIGPGGGTVTGANGAKVGIPPGALSNIIDIRIEQTSVGSPALPSGFSASGPMFAFTPHGTAFAVPVSVTLPFDSASVPTGSTPSLYKTNAAQDQWEPLTDAVFDAGTVRANVTSFSHFQVLIPPLVAGEPIREWSFSEYRGDALEEVEVSAGIQVGGILHELHDFGPASRDGDIFSLDGSSLPSDGIATGQIASSANGVTFWVGAEAPGGNTNLPDDPVGSSALLEQTQTFIKRTPDASLSFTLSAAFIETTDHNGLHFRGCPPAHVDGLTCDLVKGELRFEVQAFTVPAAPNVLPFNTFFHVAGGATLRGFRGSWDSSTWTPPYSQVPIWTVEDFDFVIEELDGESSELPEFQVEALALMILRSPRTFVVDLSAVEVGQAFTLQSITHAKTYTRNAGPPNEFGSSASAFLRDPLSSSGAALEFSGLEPIDNPTTPTPPIEAPIEPASCTPGPGPDPASGVLEFSAASYTLSEANTTPTITIQRTGGSTGAVTATFTTSDGTAIADVDYSAMNATVFFADGDATDRVVELSIIQDLTNDEPDKTVNLALSQPGGCAALGAQSTAVLTIRDDDVPSPPSPTSSFLDPTFGTEGKASSEAFGGDRSAMALQADGKIVMVGGTFTDFVLARFNANGTLDTSFDGDGKVTTDMVANEQEEALGVAIQADGKIVVVGYTGTPGSGGPANFAIARYNADGSLDAEFGSGGKIVSGVLGNAHAVAIQPDGKIVVAGDVPIQSGADFSNFAVARYNANGTLDASFAGGQFTTDFGGGTNTARNIVIQDNGAIVVSGEPVGVFTGSDHTDVVRYEANGNLDPSFGTGGKVTLNGVRVGEGIALQNDGKLVLVGTIDVSIPPALPGTATEFALVRLNTNGSPDEAFGTVSTAISEGERDSAKALTLQSDGKIVVAGQTSNINENFGVARYNTDGTLDATFGRGGTLTIDFFGFTDSAESVLMQPDGRIVIGGLARDNVDGYGVARVLP